MRVASVDIGTNSTRLLIADVDPASAAVERELSRRSRVTRLGAGVDASGRLSEEAAERVFGTLSEYRAEIERLDVRAQHRGAHLGGPRRLQRPGVRRPGP